MAKRRKEWISQRDARGALWNHFEEFVVDGDLFSFTDHAGIKLRSVQADDVWDMFLGHYTEVGKINMDRFLKDFTTWGPIASRIVELQLEARCREHSAA